MKNSCRNEKIFLYFFFHMNHDIVVVYIYHQYDIIDFFIAKQPSDVYG